ncbi:tetraprenyl-beta-curcumene synthase family protein [Pelosinus sp. sgz500959]|uniref:tetraprenyl-beta-curcumene synthase family protein n=1 Tax=Pelosinus sp. sgz500959 TaxID=3242472 RepID=UPI00366C4E2F
MFFNIVSNLSLINPFVRQVFPRVNLELAHWANYASSHACPELKEQALSSIEYKRFHCQGGSIYSLYWGVPTNDFIRLVVALQTISDYLDNLCDRTGITDEQAFRQLHLAMTDALDSAALPQDYYAFYPLKNDGGYLTTLVKTCQDELIKLPSYQLVKTELLKFARLYSDLQTYKHLDPRIRESKMINWIQRNHHDDQITDWEFAAATGSTLGMFMLCAAASDKNLTTSTVTQISAAYFPWINGLHILLDYFIDANEDLTNGDLNFVTYYTDQSQMLSHLTLFTEQALDQARTLSQPLFHKTVVQGLLAMYLSDPKTNSLKEQTVKKALLKKAGNYTTFMYLLCKLLRFLKKL